MSGGSDLGGTSNAGGGVDESDDTPYVVLETQQGGETEQQEDDDDEVYRHDEESHVYHLGLSDVDTDEDDDEPESSPIKSYGGINDFFDMPPPLPSATPVITPNLPPRYSRSRRRVLSLEFIDQTKPDTMPDVGKPDVLGVSMRPLSKIPISWHAKAYALTMVRGTPEESFTRLPCFLYNLELRNPDTVTSIRTDSRERFEMCFAALGCAIRSFTTHLRPVIIIDAAHLKGTYLGTMFLAVAMDANNQIVPIAFGVGRSESGDVWTWFLTMLKRCIGEPEGLVFVSDRAASIHQAINTVYPGAHVRIEFSTRINSQKQYQRSLRNNTLIFNETVNQHTVKYE
ncbi:hypothetical protein L6452_33852 [Arctium lappa]|uniref:Uncharacterized protein n=1 Tax=Arctium lappa TaxID=4217 RepID=A0ACB8YGR3_ARCLA|nr:hypothetical protein L6452_33852 [Arctium lappa]